MDEICRPGKFVWEKSGNSYVATFGRLTCAVSRKGRRGVNLRWRVADIFGNHHMGGGWKEDLDEVILDAEKLLEEQVRALPISVRVQPESVLRRRREQAREQAS